MEKKSASGLERLTECVKGILSVDGLIKVGDSIVMR